MKCNLTTENLVHPKQFAVQISELGSGGEGSDLHRLFASKALWRSLLAPKNLKLRHKIAVCQIVIVSEVNSEATSEVIFSRSNSYTKANLDNEKFEHFRSFFQEDLFLFYLVSREKRGAGFTFPALIKMDCSVLRPANQKNARSSTSNFSH